MLCGVSVNFCTAISAGLVCPTKLPTRTSHPKNVTHVMPQRCYPSGKTLNHLGKFLGTLPTLEFKFSLGEHTIAPLKSSLH